MSAIYIFVCVYIYIYVHIRVWVQYVYLFVYSIPQNSGALWRSVARGYDGVCMSTICMSVNVFNIATVRRSLKRCWSRTLRYMCM